MGACGALCCLQQASLTSSKSQALSPGIQGMLWSFPPKSRSSFQMDTRAALRWAHLK